MKIKHLFLGLFSVALVGTAAMNISAETEAKTGETVFMEQKCDMCHSVTSREIPSKKRSGVVDLSNSGNDGNTEFWAKYLKKDEVLNGKKHPANFRGSNEDLQILADWLGELKQD